MMTLATRLGIAAAVLFAASWARADEAQDAFDSLYGDEVKRVTATLTGADDAALAARLLDAARTPGNPPVLVAVICEKAYELAMKDSSGYPTAVAAMELLAEKVPARKAECASKLLAAQMKLFAAAKGDEKTAIGEKLLDLFAGAAAAQVAAGDLDGAVESTRQALGIAVALGSPAKAEIQAHYAALYVRQQKQKQVVTLKAKLEANPQDAATRKELIRLYVADMDNPAEAAKLLDATADETTRKLLPEAAKPLDQVPEAVCAAMGDWYRSMADQTVVVTSKAALLMRAKAYYQRFVELHAAEDLARTTATLALAKIEESMAALPAGVVPQPAAGKWTDCMPLINPDKHTVMGKWEVKNGALVSEEVRGKWAHIMIPMIPEGAYELEVAFVRTRGNDSVNVQLPMGTTACCLALSWGKGECAGLDRVKDKVPRDNETSVKPCVLENGREYVVAARVLPRGDEVEVYVTLDGKPYIKWRGPASDLKSGFSELTKLKSPAVCVFSGALELRRARLRMISGELKPAADPPLPPPPKTVVATKPRDPEPPETPAAPELINGARFFGVAARPGGPLPPGPDGWYDYMNYINPEKNTVAGKWSFASASALVITAGVKNSRLILPVTAPGNYELEVVFTRTSGSDAVVICLPVGRSACALLLGGEGGAASGLDLVNNKSYKDNETSVRPASLFNDTKYTVLVRVLLGRDEAEVVVTMNGKPYIKWKGPPSALSRDETWKLPDGRCPGLGSCDSTVIFHRARMRTLTGDGTPAK
jgi:tetratricopeptide (TPR) repeat protein